MVSIPKYSKFTSFLSFSFYCCHHSTQIEIWIIRLLLFAFFPIAEWNCQQLAANTTYKQCWMWAMGNKLLMYAMWNSCHSISAYVWCVLYTKTHTSSNRSQWCVMCAVAHDFYAMMRTQCKYTIAGNKQMFIRLRARLRVFVLKCRGFFFISIKLRLWL